MMIMLVAPSIEYMLYLTGYKLCLQTISADFVVELIVTVDSTTKLVQIAHKAFFWCKI